LPPEKAGNQKDEKPEQFMKIAVIGLGYVGLPLSLQFARSGVAVLGLDIDPAKVRSLNAGRSYIHHIHSAVVRGQVAAGRFSASTDFTRVREVEAVIICVPTPLKKNREPNISYILNTGRAIAPHLGGKAESGRRKAEFIPKLVVLESTTYPGTTEEDLREVLESGGGKLEIGNWKSRIRLKAGRDFHLAYSPEREDPGNPNSKVADIPKLVGGYTPTCLKRAVALYRKAVRTVVPMSSCRMAEATKLLENIFRGVNIALINELKVVYDAMGLDIWEVINAAKTKPFGFMPFYPGPGLGGHCIPIDPFYLAWKARQYGQDTRFIKLAGEINTAMPQYVVHRAIEALKSQHKSIRNSKVLILGLAYKPDVDDDRESPGYHLIYLLKKRGAKVAYHDPYIPVIRPSRKHSYWAGVKSVAWNRRVIGSFDAVIICTAHQMVNYRQLAQWARLIVDTRNAMKGIKTQPGQVWKA
jgi:UDP-N-acetyl-D-glucosamine dehydrogenase